jgi:hypothetical protein
MCIFVLMAFTILFQMTTSEFSTIIHIANDSAMINFLYTGPVHTRGVCCCMQVFIQIYPPGAPDVKYSNVLIALSQSLIHDSSEDIY